MERLARGEAVEGFAPLGEEDGDDEEDDGYGE